jgi:hypothetical protein
VEPVACALRQVVNDTAVAPIRNTTTEANVDPDKTAGTIQNHASRQRAEKDANTAPLRTEMNEVRGVTLSGGCRPKDSANRRERLAAPEL